MLDASNETLAPVVVVLHYSTQQDVTNTYTLTSADLRFQFGLKNGYWAIREANITYTAEISGNSAETNLGMTPYDITTPYGFCYHCTPNLRLLSAVVASETGNITKRIHFETNGFQLQPYKIRNYKFGDWYDCQGFFTAGIWAAILIGLVLAMMLAWAVSMLADVKSPDRFDDPKGKTITVTATD